MFTRVLAFFLILSIAAVPVSAHVRVTGKGDALNFDATGIPGNLKPAYNLMNQKCARCHSMEMIVSAVLTGVCPETKQPFNKQAVKAYGIKMIRKKDSEISKKEMRDIVVLINYFLDEQAR